MERGRPRLWAVASQCLWLIIAAGCPSAKGQASARLVERPFATIGPALVKGDYHQYPPFYDHVIAPHAVFADNRVYCAFQNTKGQPVVMAYDLKAGRWSEPVTASEFGLGRDAHGNPSICFDRDGFIHLFYGCHGGSMKHTRSAKPHDIRRWGEQPSPTSRATYPQSIRLAQGDLFLFYRAGGHMEPWSARTSIDNGRSWSEPKKVIEMRIDPPDRLAAAYASICPGIEGKTVHCFWVHKDDNAARVTDEKKHPWRPLKYPGLHEAVYRYNMYYVRRDADGTWRNVENRELELPISKAVADRHCLVYDSGDEFTNIGFPFVDEANRPHVRFRAGVGDWKDGGRVITPWKNLYASFDDGRWRIDDDIPTDWSVRARRFTPAKGSAAFGPESQVDWFIYYANDRYNPESPSSIFLYHPEHGYAARSPAPARLP